MVRNNLTQKVFMIVAAVVVIFILSLLVRAAYVLVSVSTFKKAWQQESQRAENKDSKIIVALGDSTVQGIGVFKRKDSFVSQVTNRVALSANQSLQVYNFSVTGAESDGVLKTQLPKLRELNRVDVIIIAVGPNDITHKKSLQSFLKNYETLLVQLPAEKTIIASLPPMGPKDTEGRTSFEWGEALKQLAQKHKVAVAPVFAKVQPHANDFRIYGGDFYHPSKAGYKLWADAFEEPLQKIIST